MSKTKKILITGAGGFIGGHLVQYFLKKGNYQIRAIDVKPLTDWYQLSREAEKG